jgi:hypothetical protein
VLRNAGTYLSRHATAIRSKRSGSFNAPSACPVLASAPGMSAAGGIGAQDQRIRIARLRLSHEYEASTTHRRARHCGLLDLRSISSPRARMCGVNYRASRSSRTAGKS